MANPSDYDRGRIDAYRDAANRLLAAARLGGKKLAKTKNVQEQAALLAATAFAGGVAATLTSYADDIANAVPCPHCKSALRPCHRGDPDMHCDNCGAVVPLRLLNKQG